MLLGYNLFCQIISSTCFKAISLCVMLLLVGVNSAIAQLPQARLYSVFPPGGQQGKTVEVKVTDGVDIDELETLKFSHPGITATPKMQTVGGKSIPVPSTFVVTIKADVPVGVYDVRARGLYGLSNPRSFVVGDLAESNETEPNDTADKPNSMTLNSTINAAMHRATDVDYFQFDGKQGQRIMLDCRADRIDSRMVAVVQLFAPNGHRLFSTHDNFRGDPLTDALLPATGKYLVKVYDLTYSGGKQNYYRLSIHTKPHIDFVMPPSGKPGSTATYTLYGRNLPGGKPTEWRIGETSLQKVNVKITLPSQATSLELAENGKPFESGLDGSIYTWKSSAGYANPITIFHAQGKIVLDEQSKEKQLTIPGEFVGQFESRNDVDTFRFTAKEKQKYSIEVFGQRNGSTTDPVLLVEQVIKDKTGKETFKKLKTVGATKAIPSIGGVVFDTRTDDPVYQLTAAVDGQYRVTVRDLNFETHADPRMVYRVVVKQTKPDFRLVALPVYPQAPNTGYNPSAITLRKGCCSEISVMAFRKDGFTGTIDLSVKGLPAGVTCQGSSIGPTQKSAILVIEADAKAAKWDGKIQVIGKVSVSDLKVNAAYKNIGERVARTGTVLRTVAKNIPAESRMARSLALSVLDEAAPYQIQNNVNTITVSQSQQILVPIQLLKQTGFDDKVALAWVGIPKNVTTKNVTIAKGKNSEILPVFVKNNVTPGVYTAYLQGTADVNYRRNPALEKRAQTVVADATKALKVATVGLTAAKKAKVDATKQKGKTPAQLKADIAKADAALKAATAKQKAADASKKAADKKLAAAKKATAAKKLKVYSPSSPIVIRVKLAPVSLTLSVPGGGAIKRGKTIEVTATIKRLNNFKGAVDLLLPLPPNVKGLTAATVQIPADKTTAKFVIQAAADATMGQLANMVVQAKANFQGDARVDAPIVLKVSK